MVTVKIGLQEHSFSDADPHWIEQQINGLKRDGAPVTVVVKIDAGDVELCFVSPPPSSGRGGGKPHSETENEIIALWIQCGMNNSDISAGNLISFLKQLPHYLP